jgi:hypothetical protein
MDEEVLGHPQPRRGLRRRRSSVSHPNLFQLTEQRRNCTSRTTTFTRTGLCRPHKFPYTHQRRRPAIRVHSFFGTDERASSAGGRDRGVMRWVGEGEGFLLRQWVQS